tara:strand:- start:318 stop:533 length:216 start_codon:yes stop_codon:yes gene_type:complete
MTPARKVTEEHIFSHDLKMWAKSAGRKFKKAYDRFIDLKKQDINSNAYWDEDNNIVIRSEDNTINEKFKDG